MTDNLPALRQCQFGRRTVAWREAGAGETLVLLHGLGGHSGSWEAQYRYFAAKRRVIGWDAPGYGGSSLLGERPTVESYADSVHTLLVHTGVDTADFVGHSFGSVIIAALARLNPGIIRRTVFLQPVAGSGALPPAEHKKVRQGRIDDLRALGMKKFAAQRGGAILGWGADAATTEAAIAVMAEVPVAGYIDAWEACCDADIFADLPSLYRPTLVICGEHDPVAPPDLGKRMAAALAEGNYAELEGVGHYASIEAPERLNQLLDPFLHFQRSHIAPA